MNATKPLQISRRQFLMASTLFWLPLKFQGKQKEETTPFRHGVASGDPLQDRVIIWTRVSDPIYRSLHVSWELARDQGFKNIVKQGRVQIRSAADYTVKVDVDGLQAGTRYYYRFWYNGKHSVIGKTKTLPVALYNDVFQIGVVGCNNWEDGYFNAFRFLAEKADVDLVLHLGDYIYEYGTGEYGDTSIGRINVPAHELVSLQDYRQRYAQYRTDPDLQLLHASKPFCLIWDDHEMANDAYSNGAKNHQPDEGDWQKRKQAAVQAYLEWLPVRARNVAGMRRKLSIGDDLDLYLLEERLEGRTKQMEPEDPGFYAVERRLLGKDQFAWLTSNLKTSNARWKLIGNQVMFTGYAVTGNYDPPKYKDWWLGYPMERDQLIRFLKDEKIRNTVFLTGDHHQSFVLAVHAEKEAMKYTQSYADVPLAWEFLTPSITSKNGDRLPEQEINKMEFMLHEESVNPQLVFGDIKSHGYYIATVGRDRLLVDYYYTSNIRSRRATESKAASFSIDADSFRVNSRLVEPINK